MKKYCNLIFKWLYSYRKLLLVFAIFLGSFILRAYDTGNRIGFGWDQVDNAWAANKILINHKILLVGMAAKLNTGFFIGPFYYYFVAFFYWLTNLNPVASQYIALTTSIFTFFIVFFITKKIFSFKVAILATFINAIALYGVEYDLTQWPVSFLPGISLLIFYFLYKVIKGEEKYVMFVALATGLAFQLHFTAIFFPIVILLCLPFFPWNKKFILYSLVSIPLFLIWLIPNFIYQFQGTNEAQSLSNYLITYYHGIHARRFFQIIGDGLIQFDPFLFLQAIKPLKILIIPIFLFVYLRRGLSKDKIAFSYLMIIFFLVPWFIFSTYKGEISDYYFSINRFIALMVVSYLLSALLSVKNKLIKILVLIFMAYYAFVNLNAILHYNIENGLNKQIEKVRSNINSGIKVGFREGIPESYIYYYLMKQKGIRVY